MMYEGKGRLELVSKNISLMWHDIYDHLDT
jgi:hypothetical protein